jgi:ABC-type glycerol-3-phosphate transport system substrate-binding protein
MKMKMNRHEFLKLASLTAAGSILAACTPGVKATTAPAEQATVVPTVAQVQNLAPTLPSEVKLPTGTTLEGFTASKPNPSEKFTLLYWWGNNYEPAMEFTNTILKRFSIAYPNIEVNPVGGQNCDAFVQAAAAGTPPDVFHTWDCVERMGNWASRGMIIPLEDYINASKFDLNDFFGDVMDTCKMDGKIWGMVDSGGLMSMWSRPSLLKDIGETEKSFPADTDQLWAWGDKLTKKDKDGNIQRLGFLPPSWTWARFAWIANFGGKLWDMNSNQPTPDDAGVLSALNDVASNVKSLGVDNLTRWSSSVGSQSGEQSPYLAGNLVYQIDGDWTGQTIFDFHPNWVPGTDYNMSVLPKPAPGKAQGTPAITLWAWPLVIPAGGKHTDYAWEFMRFMLSPEYQLNVHGKFKELVLRKSMKNDPRQWWPAATIATNMLKSGTPITPIIPMNKVASEYITLLAEAFDKIFTLAATPEESMALVKKEIIAKMNA